MVRKKLHLPASFTDMGGHVSQFFLTTWLEAEVIAWEYSYNSLKEGQTQLTCTCHWLPNPIFKFSILLWYVGNWASMDHKIKCMSSFEIDESKKWKLFGTLMTAWNPAYSPWNAYVWTNLFYFILLRKIHLSLFKLLCLDYLLCATQPILWCHNMQNTWKILDTYKYFMNINY